ncbi:MAG: phage tail family protein [Turicibacter sp.]|nr:phage tail family protein [Turicibacter sp.]
MRDVSLNGKWLSAYGGYLGQDISLDPPPIKQKLIDLPANHGSLDLSESLTGEPLYGDRTVKMTVFFEIGHLDYIQKCNEMAFDLHGKKVDLIFNNDPTWKLEGRCNVSFKPWQGYGEILLEFICKPFFYRLTQKSQTFNGASTTITNGGSLNAIPLVITTGTVTISYPNTGGGTTTRTLTTGQWKFSDFKIPANGSIVLTRTAGTTAITVQFREVRL